MKALQKAYATLGELSRAELLELRQTIDDLLTIDDNSDCSAMSNDLKLAREKRKGGAGHVELKYIRGYGPYAYLRRWKGGTLTSTYLGKFRVRERHGADRAAEHTLTAPTGQGGGQ